MVFRKVVSKVAREIIRFVRPEKKTIPNNLIKEYERIAGAISSDFYRSVAEEVIRKARSGKVLDACCGVGYLSTGIALRSKKINVTGIDLSEKAVERAKGRAKELKVENRCKFEVGDVKKMGFGDESFDFVVSVGALNRWKDPIGAINEINRVLKKGGEASIYEFCRDTTNGEIKKYQSEVYRKLKKAKISRIKQIMDIIALRKIKIDSYSLGEISTIAIKSNFKENEVSKFGVRARLVLRK